jgi:cytochrome oxidase Cu insertion factor (SCO1/SenC/PrrC family)
MKLVVKIAGQALCWVGCLLAASTLAAPHHASGTQTPAVAHHNPAPDVPLAPGYGPLGFELPAVGSYARPIIGQASDAGKVTLLSFMYASCSDVNGCPLASYVLNRVMQRLAKDPRLNERVQLLSLSFDRLNDTPEVLRKYAARFEAEQARNWRFLTTPSDAELEKILKSYNQFVIQDVDSNGKPVGSLSHLLRVYLIDEQQNLREVYSVSFLHPDILVQDMLTILSDREAP